MDLKWLKVLVNVLILVLIIFCLSSPAAAVVVLDDSFTDTAQINSDRTSAHVDTVNGWVRLPELAAPNLVAIKESGYGYAVATKDGIRVYDYDGNVLRENTFMGIANETSAVALALDSEQGGMWVMSKTALKRFDFNGTVMIYNSALSLTGLTNNISLNVQAAEKAVVLLSRSSSGTGVITRFNQTEEGGVRKVPGLSFDTGIANPVALAAVPGSRDLVYAAENAVYYYVFDAASRSYVLNPLLCQTGLAGILSVSTGEANCYAVLRESSVDFYKYDSAAGLVLSVEYSKVLPVQGISCSVRPGAFGYIVLDRSGNVTYYAFDAAAGQMTELPSLGQSGLGIISGNYSGPAEYQSILETTIQDMDTIRLTAEEINDPNTSINYQYSVDSGITWVNITPGAWLSVADFSSIMIKALLATTDSACTPRLTRVILDISRLALKGPVITDMAMPPPGQLVPASSFPANVRAGTEFAFQVETRGYASLVMASLNGGGPINLTPVNVLPADDNTWAGTFVVPAGTLQGFIYRLELTAISGISGAVTTAAVNPFVMVHGTVLQTLRVRLLF